MSTLVPWTEERVRFEQEFKPALAKLVRQHFPHWRVKELSMVEQRPGLLGDEMLLKMVVVDGISHMALEEKE